MSSRPTVFLEQKEFDIVMAGHATWLIVDGDICTGIYSNRESARGGKSSGKAGKIVRSHDVTPRLKGAPVPEPVKVMSAGASKEETPKEIVHESSVERPCKLVWHIADELKVTRPNAMRAEILAECVSRGVAYFTARTQYQQWLGVQKEMAEREAQQKVPAASK